MSLFDVWGSESSLHLRLVARTDSLQILRRRLDRWLKDAGASTRELFEIQLAANEAFANAIEHPKEPTSHLVEVEGAVADGSVSLSVRDRGRWRDEPSGQHVGGLGLAIMDELMDAVVIEPFEDGTTVTMQRRLATN